MNLEGKLLGNRYEIIEKVGNGGMATVYKATDKVLKRYVAVKILRDEFTTDSVLEVLFRMAVTVGKKIKTEVPFSHGNPSVIHQAIGFLAEKGYSLRDKTCMVIGNGEMGKVAY